MEPTDLKQIIQQAKEKYDYVRFTFSDLNGIARSRTVTLPNFEKFFDQGIEVFVGAITLGTKSDVVLLDKVTTLNLGNCVAMPVYGTLHDVPWTNSKSRVGEVLCETHWIQDRDVQPAAPRYVARRQLQALEKMGFKLYSAFEAEVVLADQNKASAFASQSIFCNFAFAQVEELLYEFDKKLRQAGVEVETLQTENAAGQIELGLSPNFGIKAADDNFILRSCIKETCLEKGKHATIMTKPFREGNCSGLHYNHSLFDLKCDSNAFSDQAQADKLSDTTRHWLAGLIKHTPALVALTSPTVNCYRRLFTPWAPGAATWGLDDRISAYRVKNYDQRRTYIESRLSGGAANPYLVLAGTVAAGIDGISNRLECPPARDVAAVELPHTLDEALTCLENDKVLVKALGEEFVEWFVTMKRKLEVEVFGDWKASRNLPQTFDKELEFYYTFL